jgi:hypothetical protein
MAKRGPKPKGKVTIRWSSDFAYALGLIVTDGSVSKNGRHISFVSNDIEQIQNFLAALQINNPVSFTKSGDSKRRTPRVQFSDRLFSDFLKSIGIVSNKTKTMSRVEIPDRYFFDFLRGHLDGDGTVYSYWDARWKSSFMFYTSFVSASKEHILWIQHTAHRLAGVVGHVSTTKQKNVYQLRYAKAESIKLWRELYPHKKVRHLSRKRLKIQRIKDIIAKR